MDKLALLKQTKKLIGKTDINTLISQSKILYDYLNSDNIILELNSLNIFENFVNEFSLIDDITGLYKPIKYFSFYDKLICEIDKNRNIAVRNRRQQGATTFCVLYALYTAVTQCNKTVVIGSLKETHKEFISDIIDELVDSVDGNILPAKDKWSKDIKKFNNGSKIIIRNVKSSFTRGLSIDYLIMDCAGYVPYKNSLEIYGEFWPQMCTGGKIIMFSDTDDNPKNSLFGALSERATNVDIR